MTTCASVYPCTTTTTGELQQAAVLTCLPSLALLPSFAGHLCTTMHSLPPTPPPPAASFMHGKHHRDSPAVQLEHTLRLSLCILTCTWTSSCKYRKRASSERLAKIVSMPSGGRSAALPLQKHERMVDIAGVGHPCQCPCCNAGSHEGMARVLLSQMLVVDALVVDA
eukprot:1160005-Pelagomonas_calceolata.AAC.11